MAEMLNRRDVLRWGICLAAGGSAAGVTSARTRGAQEAATPSRRVSPPVIILKLDDLRHVQGKPHPRWTRLADFARERRMKTTIGIICDSLEGDHPAYFAWIKEQHATGLFEFWNHGYDHGPWREGEKTGKEFMGSPLEYQKEHLARANRLAKEKLGFSLPAFGAPLNATDATTVRALRDDPDTKVWLYGNAKETAGKVVLTRVGEVNIENPLFTPSLEKFVSGYNRYPTREYFVIQGHPPVWDDARFAQFAAIVDFLVSEGAVFMTASEYAAKRAGA